MPVFAVDPEVFARFPNARFAAVVVRGIDNTGEVAEIDGRLRAAEAFVREEFAGQDPKHDPRIAIWREVFGACGWTPSKYLSSIEALTRRVAKGGELPRINPAVDLGNSVSLAELVPIGAHDLGTASDGLRVRVARDDDRFEPMGDGPEEVPEAGEIVYAAGTDIRTRRWVWRQSRSGLLGREARDVLYPIDGFAGVSEDHVRRAAEMLAGAAPRLLGGHARVYLLNPETRATDE